MSGVVDSFAQTMVSDLRERLASDAPVQMAQGQILETDDAFVYKEGVGLFVKVQLQIPEKYLGSIAECLVSGEFFSSVGGGFHSRPLSKGESVLIVLLDATISGSCLVVSRISMNKSDIPKEVSGRELNKNTISRHWFDKLPKDSQWSIEGSGTGGILNKFSSDGNYTLRFGDSVFCYAGKEKAWKIEDSSGAAIVLKDGNIQIRASSGASINVGKTISLTSAMGVSINAQNIILDSASLFAGTGKGYVFLNVAPPMAPAFLVTNAVAITSPGTGALPGLPIMGAAIGAPPAPNTVVAAPRVIVGF